MIEQDVNATPATAIQNDNPAETIGTVMTRAHQLAVRLVAEGVLESAALSEATGEASCLTLAVPGEALPFYIQPMLPEPEEVDEPCNELYIEREDPEWEPIPFIISTVAQASIEDDLQTIFEFFA